MKLKYFQVDSFTNEVFKGNPACVVQLTEWLDEKLLLKIAKEFAVAETAFFIFEEGEFQLRWFTPDLEIDLCGHATLAAAFVIKSCLNYQSNEIYFNTMSGKLKVEVFNDTYFLNFPSRKASASVLPKEIKKALSIQPKEIYKSRDYMLIYEAQSDVENIKINIEYFNQINLGYGGVIISSIGNSTDFVSRFFTPQATILEDPVTGSSHCSLIPYWSSKLNKNKMIATQLSKRGGLLKCQNMLDRVKIGGHAVLFASGEFYF